jgi:homoserine kinase
MRDTVFRPFRVEVPATTANLGPGFDALGLALGLHNVFTFEPAAALSVEIHGEGAGTIRHDAENLVVRAARAVASATSRDLPPFRLHAENHIPPARGLGSSASAVAGGLVAGNYLLGSPLAPDELLRLAVRLEGHPDNVAAALYGGLVVVGMGGDRVVHVRLEPPPGIVAALCIPEQPLPTREARAVLPKQVPLEDAVHNLSRTALLVASLARGKLDLLAVAMQDRLHQPYRAAIFPALEPCIAAALRAGALGAALSGAGSTVLALARPARAEAAAAAMVEAAGRHGYPARGMVVQLETQGTRVVMSD